MRVYILFLALLPAALVRAGAVSDLIAPNAVRSTLSTVARWQLEHPAKAPPTDWTQATFYTGLMALDGISPDPRYREAMHAMAESAGWAPGPRIYHADDHGIGQTYLELHALYVDDRMIGPLRARFDEILAAPPTNSLIFSGPPDLITRRWSWCDALFMAPPAWLQLYRATGDERYRTFALSNWWATSDLLYDRKAHLFHRDSRYLPQREANGKEVFWSRANGWVLAGLARVLQILPAHDPERPRLEKQFCEMAVAIRACQQEDGLWRFSLLDPAQYPLRESSGSAYLLYGLAWGVNQGLLDRTRFEPIIARGWRGLVKCIAEDGRLAHVQPIGADPKAFDPSHTDVYGVGGVLLAGSEVYRMALRDAIRSVSVEVRNPTSARRANETIEVPWATLHERLPNLSDETLAVMEGARGRFRTTQALDRDGDGAPEVVLVQSDFLPGESKRFEVFAGLSRADQPGPLRHTFVHLPAEHDGDVAWGNDRIAFRAYGSSSSSRLTHGSGIDLEFVSDGAGKAAMRGADSDVYPIGRSRGCGGLAIRTARGYATSGVYTQWTLRATGPIRACVELAYPPWSDDGRTFSERRLVSLDLGSHWNRFESRIEVDPPASVEVSAGLVRRAKPGDAQRVEREGWIAYTEPEGAWPGRIHTALILSTMLAESSDPEHWWARRMLRPGESFIYWAGAGWTQGGHPAPADWQRDVQLFAWYQRHPLELSFLP